MADQIIDVARQWLAEDMDEETQEELALLIEQATQESDAAAGQQALAELQDRFSTRLFFGTAGLRAELGAGPNRMNRVVIIQTAAGIAKWLKDSKAEGPVVIGYDGRKNSDKFAVDSAEVLTAAGIDVILMPKMVPTPVLAFAVQKFQASAGIMVTASHNPPADNGYKVYLGAADGGGQIVPPADNLIAEAIDEIAAGPLANIPRVSSGYQIADASIIDEYIAKSVAALPVKPTAGVELNWVYTAMHGVGWETTQKLIEALDLPAPHTVDEQLHPDPTFATVAFPNPEEPGALDLSFAKAAEHGSDIIIANDPDADRLGVAIPDGEGSYRRLTGNEVGALLGWAIAEAASSTTGTLAVSLVSSPALREVAHEYGFDYAETPTGFKWIVKQPNLVYGYEEALGYLVQPDVVSDKDGITAAALFLTLAQQLKAQGTTIAEQLEAFAKRFGYYASGQVSIRVDDISDIGRYMENLRNSTISSIAGIAVEAAEDLLDPAIAGEATADILRYRLADGSRVIARPSGTEPKLKVYLDVRIEGDDYLTQVKAGEEKLALLSDAVHELLQL